MTPHMHRMALAKHRDVLLSKAGVVMVGVGYKRVKGQPTGDHAIVCSVAVKLPLSKLAAANVVPQTVDGVATDVIEVGVIRALATLPTERWRPAPGGVSIGHEAITAGTLGCLVKIGEETLILSNNHVLANSNAGKPGDLVFQPGAHDGGRPGADTIATLRTFVPITFVGDEPPSDCRFASAVLSLLNAACGAIGSRTRYRAVRPQAGENLVDAALAAPGSFSDVEDRQLGIGPITGSTDADVGTKVVKSGRTTGVTRGEILQVDATAQVQYGAGKIALFSDQLVAGAISQGGDSGSAVLDEAGRFVGLLFAGSETVTIINRSRNVLSALGATR